MQLGHRTRASPGGMVTYGELHRWAWGFEIVSLCPQPHLVCNTARCEPLRSDRHFGSASLLVLLFDEPSPNSILPSFHASSYHVTVRPACVEQTMFPVWVTRMSRPCCIPCCSLQVRCLLDTLGCEKERWLTFTQLLRRGNQHNLIAHRLSRFVNGATCTRACSF